MALVGKINFCKEGRWVEKWMIRLKFYLGSRRISSRGLLVELKKNYHIELQGVSFWDFME